MQFGLGAVLPHSNTPSLRVAGFEDDDEDEYEALYDIHSRDRPFGREISRAISPHRPIGSFRVCRSVRKAEIQEKSLLRLVWYFC